MDLFAALLVLFVFFGLIGTLIWMSMPVLLFTMKLKIDRMEKELAAIEQKLAGIERMQAANAAAAGSTSPVPSHWPEISPSRHQEQ